MQPVSPRGERELTARRSFAASPRSSATSSEHETQYENKCPPLKLRSTQMERLRGRIKSVFLSICGLVTLVMFFNLLVGTEMISLYLAKSHTRLKNETGAVPLPNNRDHNQRPQSTGSLIRTPTERPTNAPAAVNSKTNNSTSLKYGSSDNNPKPWLDDDTAQVDPNKKEKSLARLVANASAVFAERWCDLAGVDWLPSSKTGNAWQLRAPYFLIPGAKYSGTLELAQELAAHPMIVPPSRTLETGYFFRHNFQRYVSTTQDKTKVLAARSRMYARDYPLSMAFKEADSKLLSFDATPGYLFYSSTLPRRILCVMPWIRLVIVLRDPVERVWEHYQVARSRGLTLSLEEWIEKDFSIIKQARLLNATTKDENYAWHDYQQLTLEGAIGRSLYDIQLRQWFQALRVVGRSPSKDVYVVRAEDIAMNAQKEYSAILKFLLLPDAQLTNPGAWSRFSSRQAEKEGMPIETRKRLDQFFAPYSRRLRSVLKRYKVRTGGK